MGNTKLSGLSSLDLLIIEALCNELRECIYDTYLDTYWARNANSNISEAYLKKFGTPISIRSVQRHLKSLEDRGLVHSLQRDKKNFNRRNSYCLSSKAIKDMGLDGVIPFPDEGKIREIKANLG